MEGSNKISELKNINMKYILFFLLLTTASFAQTTKGHALLDGSGFTISQAINIDNESMSGAGTAASALFAKNFFNSNLTASGNRTHDSRYKTITINKIGAWSMNYGVSGADAFSAQDSTGFSFCAPSITLSKGIGVNPRIWLDGANDRIYFTSSTGKFRFENIPTYADDTAAGVGGLSAGDIYKTSSGVLMIKL